MSCSYFLLSKEKEKELTNDNNNTIINLSNKNTFILPYNNICYYTQKGLFESSLIEWCKELCNKDKVMLDIGSHTGTYSIHLSKYCKTVYAFEPQKMTYYALCGSVCLSNCYNIECINYGLGSVDQIGTKELNIISEDGGGSSIQPQYNLISKEMIRVRTLDSFNISNIGFIKIDVEGNELDVLKGSLNTLRESDNPNILFESNTSNIELFDFINKIGYTIININGYQNMYLAASIKK